jgi:hypothetical protein
MILLSKKMIDQDREERLRLLRVQDIIFLQKQGDRAVPVFRIAK